jgi:hypothetical protein
LWLGWAYLTKKMPHAATMPIATAKSVLATEKWALESPADES